MNAPRAVAFTMYPVSDLPRSIAFYRDVLGLQPGTLESPAWYEFDIGGSTFGLGNFEQVGVPGTAQSLAIEVDDLPAFRAALVERGVEATEIFETPVCHLSMMKDPDGNSVVLHQSKRASP